ncbi:MAG: hypothetical protein ACOC9P_00670, partial [bacterium]
VLVRQLAAEVPREQGRVIEKWDGLNELGDPIEPGMYTWRGIVHDPIETEFVMSVHNSGQPPYKTSDNTGGWGADHGEPTTVCAAGEHMVLAWHHAETGWGIIRTRLNGRKQWGSKHGASHVASDGERFFKAGGGGSLDHAGVAVFDLTDSRPLNFGRGEPTTELPEDVSESPDAVTGLAHHAGRIFSAFENVNLIAVNDADSGALLDTWTVPQPRQLAVHHDGALLVVSGERVLLVRDGEHETLINDHLDAPTGIATDDEDNIYVANTGALQNVSVFNRNGEYQRSIGKQGGRPRMGRYDPAGMLEPGGIDIDREGKLWVAETLDFPKRISVWNIESGELVDEFFGGSAYSPFPWMDPKKPDEIYCHRVIWKVDLDKKTKRPYSTVWRTDAPNVVRAPAVGANSRQRVITAENGRQFLWGDYRHQARLFMRDGDIFKPIAGGIHLHPEGRWGNRQRHPLLADEEEFPDGTYIWQDANDDQTLQAEEVQPLSGPLARSGVRISWVDAQMNLWTGRGHILRPQRFENERPIYDFQNPEPTNMELLGGHIWTDPHDDSVYSMRRFPEPEQLGVARYGTDGKMQWGYRGLIRWRHAISLSPPGPGKLLGPTNPLGVAGDFTGISTYFGTYHILTREGIYVAMLFDDSRSTGGKFGANVLSAETTNGQLVQPRGTNRYYVLTGDQDGRVMRVHGLDTVEPLDGGSVRITPRQHQRAENALRKYQQQKTRSDTLALVRGGKSKLASADGVIKTLGPKHAFTVRIAYDQANLYLQYDITAPHKLINTVSDPKLLFTGGNLLDLQIATSAARDGSRKQPAPGDKRLLIGRRPSGDTIAVLYQPRVAGFEGKPVVFKSPQDRESFDSIDVISDRIALGYEQTSAGFTATATIPLEVLDWQPPPASTVKLDVGYIFGNARGNNATRRAYWSNNSFHANVVDDVPDESRLEPDQWGTAIIE